MSIILRKGLQTKMFHASSQELLENKINEFIKDKDVVDIKYNVVQDFNDYNCWDYSVLILYMNHELIEEDHKKESIMTRDIRL